MGARATRTNASGLSPLAHGPGAMLPQRWLRERGAHARTHGPKAVAVTIGRGPGRSRWSRAIGGAFLGRRARPTRRDATRACRDGRRGRLSPRPLPGPARVTVTGRRGRLPAAGAATAGPSPGRPRRALMAMARGEATLSRDAWCRRAPRARAGACVRVPCRSARESRGALARPGPSGAAGVERRMRRGSRSDSDGLGWTRIAGCVGLCGGAQGAAR